MSIKRALNQENLYKISLKLDEKCSRGISYSSQIVFFQSLHYTCFFRAICPLQVPALNLLIQLARCKFEIFGVKFVGIRPSRIYY